MGSVEDGTKHLVTELKQCTVSSYLVHDEGLENVSQDYLHHSDHSHCGGRQQVQSSGEKQEAEETECWEEHQVDHVHHWERRYVWQDEVLMVECQTIDHCNNSSSDTTPEGEDNIWYSGAVGDQDVGHSSTHSCPCSEHETNVVIIHSENIILCPGVSDVGVIVTVVDLEVVEDEGGLGTENDSSE